MAAAPILPQLPIEVMTEYTSTVWSRSVQSLQLEDRTGRHELKVLLSRSGRSRAEFPQELFSMRRSTDESIRRPSDEL
jgi:hypothetical protein